MKSYDPTDTAALDRSRTEQADKEKRARRLEIEDLQQVMRTKAGRRHIWRLLEVTGVYRTSFASDPLQTAFNEGQRNIGLRTLSDCLSYAEPEYTLMLKEHRTK